MYQITPFGEAAAIVRFGDEIRPEIHQKISAFNDFLESNPFPGMLEYVPSFTAVTIFYDPLLVRQKWENHSDILEPKISFSFDRVEAFLQNALQNLSSTNDHKPQLIEIPVCYGGDFGPDLEYVAEYHKMTPQEVIHIHSKAEYLVYMIGFAPGFPYLGGLSEKIATPRRSTPRTAIPKGSVGIAGDQTGAYPIETPGGWQLIGQTPLDLFRPEIDPPILLKSGNIVKFKPITLEEYHSYKEARS